MINYPYKQLLDGGNFKEYRIQVYDGTTLESVITNEELFNQKMEWYHPLCTEATLTYGSVESSYVKFDVDSSVSSLKGKKLKVFVFPGDITLEPLQMGEYFVDSDKLSDDRKSKQIIAYDALNTIFNTNMHDWYVDLEFPMTMKDFRDEFFNHFEVTQVETTLCNDSMVITQTTIGDQCSGLEMLQFILAGNGVLGAINNEGNFKYICLSDYGTKNYGVEYKLGTLVYEDYAVKPITKLTFRINNDVSVSVGEDGNEYIMEDNFLFFDKLEENLEVFVQNIFDVIKETPVYTPLKAETWGDPCTEVGDMISFTTQEGSTVQTFIFEKFEKGLQVLSDEYETKGTEYFEVELNGGNSEIRRIGNSVIALESKVSGARTYVYAQRPSRQFNIGSASETEIISIFIVTVDETIPIFLATIPLVMSADGEVTFRYYLDDLQVEGDDDTIYLTKGEQFVTISTFFEAQKDTRVKFSVTAQTGYRESENRLQDAKILSIKDWIDNQSISIDPETGEASFDYAYVEQDPDETPPTAFIDRRKIRASIFASGLAPEEPWDGTIRVIEEVADFDITEIGFDGNVNDTVTVIPQTPTSIVLSDNASEFTITELTFESGIREAVSVRTFTTSYPIETESGEIIETEDGQEIWTEGDEE